MAGSPTVDPAAMLLGFSSDPASFLRSKLSNINANPANCLVLLIHQEEDAMAQSQTAIETHQTPATSADVKGVLGDMDEAQVLAILALEPTVADLEMASMSLSGDNDVYGAGPPLKGVAGEIVALLTVDEEEER